MIVSTYEYNHALSKNDVARLENVFGYEIAVPDDFYELPEDERQFSNLFYDVLLDADKAIQLDWKWDERELFAQLADVLPEQNIKLITSEVENADSKEDAIVHMHFSISDKEMKSSVDWYTGLSDYVEELSEHLKETSGFQLVVYATGGDEYCWFKAKSSFSELEFYAVVAPGRKWKQTPIPTKLDIKDEVLNEKIFYIPLFKSETSTLHYLRNGQWYKYAYASRVMPGETLNQAIANDLRNDFNYTGGFRVDEVDSHDELKDKEGKLIPRYKVKVQLLDKLDAEKAKPLGMKVEWSIPQKKKPKYRFHIEWNDSVTSDTFYLLIRSAVLNDESKKSLRKIVDDWVDEGIEKGYGSDGYMHYIESQPKWETIEGKDYFEAYIDLGSVDTEAALDELLKRLGSSDLPIERVYFGEMIIGIKEKRSKSI